MCNSCQSFKLHWRLSPNRSTLDIGVLGFFGIVSHKEQPPEVWSLPPVTPCILITVQRDATQSSLFIILQVHSTCLGCQPHPSSGVHKTVTTASGTGHMFVQLSPSNVAKLAWPCRKEVAAQKI